VVSGPKKNFVKISKCWWNLGQKKFLALQSIETPEKRILLIFIPKYIFEILIFIISYVL